MNFAGCADAMFACLAPLMTTRPHDALFKWMFEAPVDAAALLRELLPPTVSEAIVWETVERELGSFVDTALADRHNDRLFLARLRTGEPGIAYLLLEHQSTGDPAMPLRMLAYQLQLWARFRKENPGARLPPIIAVLVTHVPGGWTTARSIEELFDPAMLAIPGLAALAPRCSMIVDDLARVSNDELKARSLAVFQQLALSLLRDAREPARLLASFEDWMPALVEPIQTEAGFESFGVLITYLFRVLDPVSVAALRVKLARLGRRAEEAVMTYAEYLEEKGRAQGREEGRIATLRSLLVFKFQRLDADAEARLQAATPEAIDRYLRRVLSAETLAAVFED
jgi:hypothetical protein